jgi:hypothetical protein
LRDTGIGWALEVSNASIHHPGVSVDQIKTAIEQLSFEERAELAAWLHGWKDDEWDEQMKRDVASGRLDHILREVDEDIHAEKLREMP